MDHRWCARSMDQGSPGEPARRAWSGPAPVPSATRGSPKDAPRPPCAGTAGCYPSLGAGHSEPALSLIHI
eukprot:311183-Alexandrium_andersonii.AAC.1